MILCIDDCNVRHRGNDHLALSMRSNGCPDPAAYYETPPAVGVRPGLTDVRNRCMTVLVRLDVVPIVIRKGLRLNI